MTTGERDRDGTGPRLRGGGQRAAPVTVLSSYIERRGLKHSRQRELVADAFFATPGHVSVEELVARARARDPRVSVATVYRTVKLLVESGLATARQFGGGQTRYEAAAGKAHHDHLICTACGEIVEFADEQIEALQALVARRHGFEVESHKLELYGRCDRCRRRRARAEGRP
jgi:Fur family ferric uptake transcriptional regulator